MILFNLALGFVTISKTTVITLIVAMTTDFMTTVAMVMMPILSLLQLTFIQQYASLRKSLVKHLKHINPQEIVTTHLYQYRISIYNFMRSMSYNDTKIMV